MVDLILKVDFGKELSNRIQKENKDISKDICKVSETSRQRCKP